MNFPVSESWGISQRSSLARVQEWRDGLKLNVFTAIFSSPRLIADTAPSDLTSLVKGVSHGHQDGRSSGAVMSREGFSPQTHRDPLSTLSYALPLFLCFSTLYLGIKNFFKSSNSQGASRFSPKTVK